MTPHDGAAARGHDKSGADAFEAALGGHKQPAPAQETLPPPPPVVFDPPEFLQILPRPQLPLPEPLPWQAPETIYTVHAALRTLSSLDRTMTRRLLVRFGGALDAGQLGYVLDCDAAVAQAVILLMDEVGDGKLGAEELDPDTIAAVLTAYEGPGDDAPDPIDRVVSTHSLRSKMRASGNARGRAQLARVPQLA